MDGSNGSDGSTRGPGTSGTSRAETDPPDHATPDLAALARDWIELWQSEVTALAADPETAETWARLASLWAGAAASGIAAMPRGVGGEHGVPFQPSGPFTWAFSGPFSGPPSWPTQAPRPTPAAAAPDAGGDATRRNAGGDDARSNNARSGDSGTNNQGRLLERVLAQLEAIERRLAALEQRGLDEPAGPGKGGDDRRRPRRRRARPAG